MSPNKEDIKGVLLYYARFFPFVHGDVPTREEIVDAMADVLLEDPQNKWWPKVRELTPMMP